MKRLIAFVLLGMICLTACGRNGEAELPADSKAETDLPADSKAETKVPADSEEAAELPVYYGGGSSTMDRMLPASYSDLVNHSDAVVIAEPVAEKEQFINKSYDANLERMLAGSGYTVVSYKVDQVIMGDVKEGDTLDIREYHYNWVWYEEDGSTTDCIICRSNAKPSVIGETYLLFLTKRSDEETWDCTFGEYGIYTYDNRIVGSWLREDMDQESYDYKLYQRIFSVVADQMSESDDADH